MGNAFSLYSVEIIAKDRKCFQIETIIYLLSVFFANSGMDSRSQA